MIPLRKPAAAPPVTRAVFAYWLGGSGAPPAAPIRPPEGAYWHQRYWPDKPPG